MARKIFTFVVSIVASLAAGAIGSVFTTPNIPTWYAALEKPLLNPPNFVFGPVWSLLYVVIGIALALVILEKISVSKRSAYIWFGAQLALNTLWSIVFFGLQSPIGGIVVILALIISIAMTMRTFWPIKHMATYLLIPYLAWVCFATYLNIGVAILNS